MDVPEVRYAKSGEVHVAYQTVGSGAIDLVLGLPYVGHLGVWWEYGPAAEFFYGLASLGRLILFDKRGVGLSDRDVGVPTLEERMDDFRAVMDAVGSKKALILGASESGAMSILYAATYPDRVSALILAGAYARATRAPDYPLGDTPEEVTDYLQRVDQEWGSPKFVQEFADGLARGLSQDVGYIQWVRRLLTFGASPAAAVRLAKMDSAIDVRSVLGSVHVPTLVLGEDSDWAKKASGYLAEHIPGAKLVGIPGKSHLFFVSREASRSVVEAIRDFVGDLPGTPESNRVLTTVLFTDIVGSTQRAAELGDRAWSKLLGQYLDAARTELTRYQGHLVKTTGDGLLATFDGPTRAIRCACALRDRARESGFEIRAGLHSGECVLKDQDVQGIAVHIASRVTEKAGDSEVLVSSTVRDLSIGSDIRFTDRGAQPLKGLEGDWRMYSVAST